jgi:hypothetical protein
MYLDKTAFTHSKQLHALSTSVRSREAVDVNLALFELLGRLAIRGCWTASLAQSYAKENEGLAKALRQSTRQVLDAMIQVINSNPTLNSPFKDDHMIEIALVMYLAQFTNSTARFIPWLKAISHQISLSLSINSHYPTCFREYTDVLNHPASADQSYRDEACIGSVLFPYLFVWLGYSADDAVIVEFQDRLSSLLPNCTHQAWLPDEDTDELIWQGNTHHGVCVTDLSPQRGFEEVAGTLNLAIENCTNINDISAVKAGMGVLFLAACRHFRLPIPPHFWIIGS